MAWVVVDAPQVVAANVPATLVAVTAPTAYVRFHGRNAGTWNVRGGSAAQRFDYLYAEDELRGWAEPLRELAGAAEQAYAFFNNNNQTDGVAQAPAGAGAAPEAARRGVGGERLMRVLAVIHGPTVRPGGLRRRDRRGRATSCSSGTSAGRERRPTTSTRCSCSAATRTSARSSSIRGCTRSTRRSAAGSSRRRRCSAICLGAQTLAHALGCAGRGASRRQLVGFHDTVLTAEGERDPVLGVLPRRFRSYNQNAYAFEVPGRRRAARRGPVAQAFRVGASPGACSSIRRCAATRRSRWWADDAAPAPARRAGARARRRARRLAGARPPPLPRVPRCRGRLTATRRATDWRETKQPVAGPARAGHTGEPREAGEQRLAASCSRTAASRSAAAAVVGVVEDPARADDRRPACVAVSVKPCQSTPPRRPEAAGLELPGVVGVDDLALHVARRARERAGTRCSPTASGSPAGSWLTPQRRSATRAATSSASRTRPLTRSAGRPRDHSCHEPT